MTRKMNRATDLEGSGSCQDGEMAWAPGSASSNQPSSSFCHIATAGKCLWEATHITNSRPWEGCRSSEIAACGKDKDLHPPGDEYGPMDALQTWPWEDQVEKSLSNSALAIPLCCLLTTSPSHSPDYLLRQLWSLKWCPWDDTEAAERGPSLSNRLSKTGEDWLAALEHSLPPPPPQYSFSNERQPRETASSWCCITMKNEAGITEEESCETVKSLESTKFCGTWRHSEQRPTPSSLCKFPTVYRAGSLAFGLCLKCIFRRSGSSFLFRCPAATGADAPREHELSKLTRGQPAVNLKEKAQTRQHTPSEAKILGQIKN